MTATQTKSNQKAAIYARVSKDDARSRAEQQRENASIEQQIADAKDKAAAEGCTVETRHVFIDLNLSGKLPPQQWAKSARAKTRPQFTALLGAIERGEINAVIVRKRDRLCRSTRMTLDLYEALKAHKVRLICTHETLPQSNDASGMFALTILAAAAEFELQKTSENICATLAHNRREGRKHGCARQIIGYRDGEKPGAVVVDEGGAAIVRDVFDRYVAGQSMRQIARWLRASHGDIRGAWGKHSVHKIIRQPRYVGMIRDSNVGYVASNAWPKIISPDTWRTANDMMRSRKCTHVKRGYRLLSGFLKCAACGNSLIHFERQASPYPGRYQCSERNEKTRSSPHAFCMTAPEWELWYDTFFSAISTSTVAETPEAVEFRMKAARMQENLEQLEQSFATGARDFAEYERLSYTLKKAIAQNEAKLAAAVTVSSSKITEWKDMTLDEKRSTIHQIAPKIIVRKHEVEVETHSGTPDDPTVSRIVFPLMQKRVHERWRYSLCPDGLTQEDAIAVKRWNDDHTEARIDWTTFKGPDFRSPGDIAAEKRCTTCRHVKPLAEFHKNQRYRDGHNSRCRPCALAGAMHWRQLRMMAKAA